MYRVLIAVTLLTLANNHLIRVNAQEPPPSPTETALERRVRELEERLLREDKAKGLTEQGEDKELGQEAFDPTSGLRRLDAILPVEGSKPAAEASPKKSREFIVGTQTETHGFWNNGMQFESADKSFLIYLGGRLHVDFGWWQASKEIQYGDGGVGELDDAANFRRARLRTGGKLWDTVQFFGEYGFESGSPQFFDVFGELYDTPLGSLRVGHFREPFSMDALTNGNWLTFMERSLIQDAFVPFRNTGVTWHAPPVIEETTLAAGLFRSNSNGVGADFGDGNYAFTSRWTLNPWYENDGRCALHLGAAYSRRHLPELTSTGTPVPSGTGGHGRVIFQSRPEERILSVNFVSTGYVVASDVSLLGLEAGLGLGQFLFQAEYVGAWTHDAVLPNGDRGTLFYHGGYAQASWFLTGECRPYLRRLGTFGQVIPHENYWFKSGQDDRWLFGSGAWELAARVSYLDLNDQGILGGRLLDLTLGLNWYLNPNVRVTWNYIHLERDVPIDTGDGSVEFLGTRLQVDY